MQDQVLRRIFILAGLALLLWVLSLLKPVVFTICRGIFLPICLVRLCRCPL